MRQSTGPRNAKPRMTSHTGMHLNPIPQVSRERRPTCTTIRQSTDYYNVKSYRTVGPDPPPEGERAAATLPRLAVRRLTDRPLGGGLSSYGTYIVAFRMKPDFRLITA